MYQLNDMIKICPLEFANDVKMEYGLPLIVFEFIGMMIGVDALGHIRNSLFKEKAKPVLDAYSSAFKKLKT